MKPLLFFCFIVTALLLLLPVNVLGGSNSFNWVRPINSSSSSPGGDSSYWRLDGSNAPPSSDWDMRNKKFSFNYSTDITHRTPAINFDVNGKSNGVIGYYIADPLLVTQYDGLYILSNHSMYIGNIGGSRFTYFSGNMILDAITEESTDSIMFKDNDSLYFGTGRFGVSDIKTVYNGSRNELLFYPGASANPKINITIPVRVFTQYIGRNLTVNGNITAKNICYTNGSNCPVSSSVPTWVFSKNGTRTATGPFNMGKKMLLNVSQIKPQVDGLKIANSTFDKISFYGAPPVVQQSMGTELFATLQAYGLLPITSVSETITTTGAVSTGGLTCTGATLSSTKPLFTLTDTTLGDDDFKLANEADVFTIVNVDNTKAYITLGSTVSAAVQSVAINGTFNIGSRAKSYNISMWYGTTQYCCGMNSAATFACKSGAC